MEPWHFSHGEPVGSGPVPVASCASMEPWHFSHGEMRIRPALQVVQGSFNGAMAF